MASIRHRMLKDGNFSYQVDIRKKGFELHQSFYTEEDAKLFAFYKERLIDNMESFDIPLSKRVTLDQIFELKIKTLDQFNKRSIAEFENPLRLIKEIFKEKIFIHQISFDDWLAAAKEIYGISVFRGAKKEHNKRLISPNSLRRYFASCSSAFSYAQSQGIELDNHPLKVIQTYITPLLKEKITTYE